MGFFSKSNKHSKQENTATIIGSGTYIKGAIQTDGSVFVDGIFEGGIIAKHSLSVGKNGKVVGEIKVGDLLVSGLLDGIVYADNITILSTGRIIGNIHYNNLKIEENGIFEGQGKMRDSTLKSEYKTLINDNIKELIQEV